MKRALSKIYLITHSVEVFPHNGGESVFCAVNGLLRLLVDNGRFYQRDSFYPTCPSHTDLAVALMDNILPMDVQLTGAQEVSTVVISTIESQNFVGKHDLLGCTIKPSAARQSCSTVLEGGQSHQSL